ncbi:helix-turn-helix domain-containing protein [Methylomonas sp. MED-D]|uniref:Putative Fis-like DNA-binding protein n=1 Tax=Methylomonas koyamae TaxID=702114 RepID=A0A177P8A4_9GAMM|nr:MULTISPECIES: helix-turn-helix domain-containing protein [Methylomonas]MDT4332314.1 helix-turn-helix domain-containing protein [Methylomonas sp. MV1]OAI26114.1 Fis family transcriptional regulator [Methylomonas koyamae]OHX37624.1 Fis family transcriptional regulator [Methylomonas sp. LWB]WGS85516.1 helix-turn-helix domain-containing protein [Methylomonas sp. UP202]
MGSHDSQNASDSVDTLSDHVRHCVEDYFSHLNGHDSSGLYHLVLAEVEKPLLETTLKYCDFNQSKAAVILGLSRSTLRKKLDHYGIG